MFDKLLKSAAAVVTTPAAIAADIVTVGGIATDRDEPYTVSAVKAAARNVGKAVDDLDKG
jgi:hypothetical protein